MSETKRYYNVFDDIASYPEAIIIIAYSRRGVGKTYSMLKNSYQLWKESGGTRGRITYVKRTIEDVNLICSSTEEFDASPYAPINRDLGTNIRPRKVKNGIGAFYDMDDPSEHKKPCAYVVALSAIKNVKGIEMPCDYLVFDEFIPQVSESIRGVSSAEGEALLDLYMTLSRDREKRRSPDDPDLHMRLILFANAEELYCPVIEELNVLPALAEIARFGYTYHYIPERKILIHHVNEIPLEDEEMTGIYLCMKNTRWARKSFGGEFSKVDFSNIDKKALKQYVPLIHLHYKEDDYYLYRKDREFYICQSRPSRVIAEYNLNRDNDIRKFYYTHVSDLQDACMDGYFKFSDYAIYDLITNYSKRFKGVLQ